MITNPFNYGRPIEDPGRFVGRSREIDQVYSRILTACESTSVVGESRMGKTSLLKVLQHPEIQAQYNIDQESFVFIYQDFQLLGAKTTPTRFWKRVLKSLKRALKENESVVEEIDIALDSEEIDNYILEDVFTVIDEEDLRIILLLDEFENVTRNLNFDSDFFAGLRALAIHHNLALVTCSHHDLVELTHSKELRSSPFFNIFATVQLRPFSEAEVTEFLDSYLRDTGVRFLLSEMNMVFALAGFHPYHLQMTCHHLYNAHVEGLSDAARRDFLLAQVRQEASPLYHDYWVDSSMPQQLLLTILTMRELEDTDAKNTLEELDHFYSRSGQVISEVERRGIIVLNAETNSYRLFSSEFREWIADEIIGKTEDLRSWREWQKNETMIGQLPKDLQELISVVVKGLNPKYQDMFTSFMLDPHSAKESIKLVQNFVSRYEHYKETREERQPSETTLVAPVQSSASIGGLFALTGQKLADREAGREAPAQRTTAPDAQPTPPPPAISEPEPSAPAPTGRMLKRLKKSAVSPIALSNLIISGIVASLEFDESDEDFVNGEIEWLFYGLDHYLKVCRDEANRSNEVSISIPPDAERESSANNRLLSSLDMAALQGMRSSVEDQLERLDGRFKSLNNLLNEEAKLGLKAKTDLELQSNIKSQRVDIVKITSDLASLAGRLYGIQVTSPKQLIEVVESE